MQAARPAAWLSFTARASGALVLGVGLLVLIGWTIGNSLLTRIADGWPQMAPLAALGFVLLGAALVTLSQDQRPLAGVLSLAAAVLGGTRLLAYLAGAEWSFDTLGLVQPLTRTRMSIATALCMATLGTATWLATREHLSRAFQPLVLTAVVFSWLGTSRFLFGGEPLIPLTGMAVHSALSFLALSTGVTFVRADTPLTRLVTSRAAGGAMARRLLPAVLLTPLLVGWLPVLAQRLGWLGAEAGLSLFALLNMLVFGLAVWACTAAVERADEQRQAGERLLQTIMDNAAAAIYVKDLQGRYQQVNRGFCELLHLQPQAIVGRSDHDLLPASAADGLRAADERALRSSQPLVEEEHVPRDDGPSRTYLSVKNVLRDAAGQAIGVFGISTDISERKRAEEALRANEDRVRQIVENALDAVITIDARGFITGWNAHAQATFGWTSSEVMGRRLSETIIPPRYREAHERGLQRYLLTGQATVLNRRIELHALHRDGREFPIELAITAHSAAGVTGFSAFVRDIGERKRTEARLQAQLERLHLLDQITVAVGERQDLQGIYQVALRNLEERLPVDFCGVLRHDGPSRQLVLESFGARSGEIAGLFGLAIGSALPIDDDGLVRCVQQAQLVYETDLAGLNASLAQRLARGGMGSLVVAPLQAESRVLGVLAVARHEPHAFSSGECEFLRQLSAHVALAARQAELHGSLQHAYDDLRQTQQVVMQQERLRALGQMASGIAHDINNAISPVMLYTEHLLEREPGLTPTARAALENISRAVDDVASTVARMREFYRQREPAFVPASVDLNRMAEQVAELTRARWSDMPQQRGVVIHLRSELASGLPLAVGVESEIREALINLVFNAVDAMPQGGDLVLRTYSAGPRVSIEVSDSGIGMDEDTRRRCMEPFFTTKGERGTGLGLAMVYGVAHRHGAEVDIRSTVGEGTTVSLAFTPAAAQASNEPSPAQPQRVARLRLLVVDDDPMVLRTLQDMLEADGHDVVAAGAGQSGIDAFLASQARSKPFAVVLTDLGMPYVDGQRVARAVKRVSPRTPVVLLTGWGQGFNGDGEHVENVDMVLGKPPKLRELREALRKLSG